MEFPDNLNRKLTNRNADFSFRKLSKQKGLVDFSSNDYLGFSQNISIAYRVMEELNNLQFLNGSTGSRLLTGNHLLHEEIEVELASFFKSPAALLFNSGYDANAGLLSSVPQRGDVVFFDELCHASIRDGIRLSHAKSYSFKHNNVEDLGNKYNNVKNQNGNAFLVVESIYSMDGDSAALLDLSEFCKKNNIYFIVDEAHATGIYGELGAGLVVELNLEKSIFARIHTFGKAMGCQGAVILGSDKLRSYLINYARSFIYTTAMSLHNVLTIKYALKELTVTPERAKLMKNISLFKSEIHRWRMEKIFISSNSPIQSCVISNNERVKDVSQKFELNNYDIKAILSPSVPIGTERLRFCIHSFNSKGEIREIFNLLSTFV